MLINLIMFLIISNAVALRRDKSTLYSRISIVFFNTQVTSLSVGTGLFGGLFNITSLTQHFNIFIFLISAVILLMSVGFIFKISAAPFHYWSPDVYGGIPTIVTTYVAIIAKISILIFFYLNVIKNIFFYKTDYNKNPAVDDITISNSLYSIISIVTLLLLLFIYICQD